MVKGNEGFIYVGQYFHRNGLNLQELGITEKKIGKTIDLTQREKGLNSTKMNIGYVMVAAFEVSNMEKGEKSMHYLLDHNRLNGEWFTDPNDDLISRVRRYMNLNDFAEVPLDDNPNEDVLSNRTRRKVQDTSKEELVYTVNGVEISGYRISDLQFNILEELIVNQKIDPLTIVKELYPNYESAKSSKYYKNGGQLLFQECYSDTYTGVSEGYDDIRKWITPDWGTISNGNGNFKKLLSLKCAEIKQLPPSNT
jgi:hypothetical protein